jgi:molybdenum cofactor cytidylyltransferase
MVDDNGIGFIVLAAGSSSRMGQSKQLLPIGGEPLLRRSVRTAVEAGARNVVVVLGHQEEVHRKVIEQLPIEIISNKNWPNGMGGSLKAGLAHTLQSHADTRAIVVMVCDQPDVTSKHLIKLIEAFTDSRKSIVASGYSNTAGVPALFSSHHFAEILSLDDSQGAKKILENHRSTLGVIHFPEGARDLDTPDDYTNFIQGK